MAFCPVPVTRGRDARKRVAPSGFLSSTRDTRPKGRTLPWPVWHAHRAALPGARIAIRRPLPRSTVGLERAVRGPGDFYDCRPYCVNRQGLKVRVSLSVLSSLAHCKVYRRYQVYNTTTLLDYDAFVPPPTSLKPQRPVRVCEEFAWSPAGRGAARRARAARAGPEHQSTRHPARTRRCGGRRGGGEARERDRVKRTCVPTARHEPSPPHRPPADP